MSCNARYVTKIYFRSPNYKLDSVTTAVVLYPRGFLVVERSAEWMQERCFQNFSVISLANLGHFNLKASGMMTWKLVVVILLFLVGETLCVEKTGYYNFTEHRFFNLKDQRRIQLWKLCSLPQHNKYFLFLGLGAFLKSDISMAPLASAMERTEYRICAFQLIYTRE